VRSRSSAGTEVSQIIVQANHCKSWGVWSFHNAYDEAQRAGSGAPGRLLRKSQEAQPGVACTQMFGIQDFISKRRTKHPVHDPCDKGIYNNCRITWLNKHSDKEAENKHAAPEDDERIVNTTSGNTNMNEGSHEADKGQKICSSSWY
jgi:hypothetical protein